MENNKQETLEEVAEKWFNEQGFNIYNHYDTRPSFIAGAKWQQEQDKSKYSEEEVGKLITEAIKRTAQYCNINKLYGDTIEQFSEEWFNENKKK